MTLLRSVAAPGLLLLLSLTACQVRGIPAHGGGKRFYREQEVLALATQNALDLVDWRQVGSSVRVFVFTVGDEGGGVQSGGGLRLSGLMGGGASKSMGPGTGFGGGGVSFSNLEYAPLAVASNRDIEYLRGAVMGALYDAGSTVVTNIDAGKAQGDVVILAHVFGTDRWTDRTLFVFRDEHLDAHVRLDAWYVPGSGRPIRLTPGGASAYSQYIEEYFFGFIRDRHGAVVTSTGGGPVGPPTP